MQVLNVCFLFLLLKYKFLKMKDFGAVQHCIPSKIAQRTKTEKVLNKYMFSI